MIVNKKLTNASLSNESRKTPTPFQWSFEPNTGPSTPGCSVNQIAWKEK
jgi:hypothetical protein